MFSYENLYEPLPKWLQLERDAEAMFGGIKSLPSAADLDAVAEEEKAREATNGRTDK